MKGVIDDAEAVGDAVAVTAHDVPNDVAEPAPHADEEPTLPAVAVAVADAALGDPAAKPVTVDVDPLSVIVDVVNCTCGTVKVVTTVDSELDEGIVWPAETPVL